MKANGSPAKFSRPFLHPTISRLRSSIPQTLHTPSVSSVGTFHSHAFDGLSPSPSRFSSISRSSSLSVLRAGQAGASDGHAGPEREVFRWTQLRAISHDIYQKPQKISSVLGTASQGSPTVLAANGLICVGTDHGKIYVYDFKQTLKCICGTDSSGKAPTLQSILQSLIHLQPRLRDRSRHLLYRMTIPM
jgi:vacuolar protein sorting-associated protein 8